MIGVARPIKLRVFLEGIEVPCLGAQIQSQPNAPAQCVLQLPPAELGTRLHPRTLVHVFFLDHMEEAASSLRSYRGGDTTDPEKNSTPSVYQSSVDRAMSLEMSPEEWAREQRNRGYKLLFCGEILSFQWNKAPLNRSLTVQCLDLSNYWDYAYQFNNTDLFGPGIKAILSGGSTNLFTDFLSSPGEIMSGILKLPSANFPSLKGALGGLIRVIESIGGCYRQGEKFVGQNIFFAIAELRLRISLMLSAYPHDQTINRLLSGGGPDAIFGRTLGNLGEQVSIRTVFNAIAGILFHETFAVPTAYYSRGTEENPTGARLVKVQDYPNTQYIHVLVEQIWLFVQEMVKVIEGTPGYADSRDVYKERSLTLRRFQHVSNSISKTMQRARMDKSLRTTRNKKVREMLSQIHARLRSVAAAVGKKWKPGDTPAKNPALKGIAVELNKIGVLAVALKKFELDLSDAKTRVPARLHNQIIKPDTWFTAPPRCNVLFPHHYFNMSYARSFMQEPTRLLLKVHDEFFGEDELFDKYFFAPRSQTMRGKRHKGTLQELFQRDLLSHELFTGIVPIFTKMGEFNILALRGYKEMMKKAKDRPKISLAQRTANFLYFKNRFGSRNMSIQAVFNPWAAPGFPGLIIDRYVQPEDVETYLEGLKKQGKATPELRQLLGTHFLGTFSMVAHNLAPMSAETTIQVQYAREYAESAEFLGPAVKDDQRVVKRFGTDAIRTYTVAALEKPKLGGIGIYYGTIQKVEDITDSLSPENPSPSTQQSQWLIAPKPGEAPLYFPIYTGPRRVGDPAEDGTAPVGVPVRLGDYSPKLSAQRGPGSVVTFRAYQVREAIPRYRREKVDLPAEEAIRPGWYDDIWHPAQIGKVYQTFFETGSITDMTQIADPGGVSTGDPSKHARDQLATDVTGKMQGDPRAVAPAILTLDGGSSIEQAVDFLLTTYAYVKQGGLSDQKFTDAYTWRPIASLADIFGSSDLELDVAGIKVTRGVEGFHSRAFGPYNDLFGLVTPDVSEVLGAKRTDQARSMGDVRGERHQAVLNFVDAVRQIHKRGGSGG